jgi:hypothetical protein
VRFANFWCCVRRLLRELAWNNKPPTLKKTTSISEDDLFSKDHLSSHPQRSSLSISDIVRWSPSTFKRSNLVWFKIQTTLSFFAGTVMASAWRARILALRWGSISCFCDSRENFVSHHHGSLRSSAVATCAPRWERVRAAVRKSTQQHELSSLSCEAIPIPYFFLWQTVQIASPASSIPWEQHIQLSKIWYREYMRWSSYDKRCPSNPHCW